MIARLIEWSTRNIMLVMIGVVFMVAAGLYALRHLPLDAIPDLSDTQVIVYTEFPGQAPQVVEDQVTYPLSTAMLTVPKSKVVRGFSFFGVSFVYIIFEDGTDIYWARSRVLEFLNAAATRLPTGVTPTLGPDATGVGWVYQYALKSKELSLADTRALQDWTLRFALAKAEGVAEVAPVGGFVRQYNVVLDPQRMRDLGITMQKVREAIRASNADVGGRTVELSEFEYVVRGRGYLRSVNDIADIVLKTAGGTPVTVHDIARVELGPDERRGIAELNGEGEVASGIVLQRLGANALDVIDGLKKRFAELASSLPPSVEIVPVYDRSALINAAIATLKATLIEESLIVALVCIVFLLHVRSALVAILMLPVGVLMAFAAMKALGIGSNIMSLGGIAIAIGAMVDAAIVMIENAHKHLERASPEESRVAILTKAATEVGPALFFSLLVITVSFLPIFTLESQEGRLFGPLAFTKTFAMAAAALLSVTLVPALMILFVRGRIIPEHSNPINRALIFIYRPVIRGVLKAKGFVIVAALLVLGAAIWPARQLGTEFMPNLDEGTLLYMPTTLPGISVTKAAELMQTQDRIIRGFPEVVSVLGKAGRAATATDPAPSEMFETLIAFKPKGEWRPGVTIESLTAEMDKALQFPGVSNAWTMPIKARIDMLSTGIRTPVGVKIIGNDLATLETTAKQVEAVLKTVPGTSSAYAERVTGGYYLEITPDRSAMARYGIMVLILFVIPTFPPPKQVGFAPRFLAGARMRPGSNPPATFCTPTKLPQFPRSMLSASPCAESWSGDHRRVRSGTQILDRRRRPKHGENENGDVIYPHRQHRAGAHSGHVHHHQLSPGSVLGARMTITRRWPLCVACNEVYVVASGRAEEGAFEKPTICSLAQAAPIAFKLPSVCNFRHTAGMRRRSPSCRRVCRSPWRTHRKSPRIPRRYVCDVVKPEA